MRCSAVGEMKHTRIPLMILSQVGTARCSCIATAHEKAEGHPAIGKIFAGENVFCIFCGPGASCQGFGNMCVVAANAVTADQNLSFFRHILLKVPQEPTILAKSMQEYSLIVACCRPSGIWGSCIAMPRSGKTGSQGMLHRDAQDGSHITTAEKIKFPDKQTVTACGQIVHCCSF